MEDAGGKVVGPSASCEEALALLANGTVAAAILDVNLVDGESSPLVEALVSLDVPFIATQPWISRRPWRRSFQTWSSGSSLARRRVWSRNLRSCSSSMSALSEPPSRLHFISERYNALKNEPSLPDEGCWRGLVVPGLIADLVILCADPGVDIAALGRLSAVIARGFCQQPARPCG